MTSAMKLARTTCHSPLSLRIPHSRRATAATVGPQSLKPHQPRRPATHAGRPFESRTIFTLAKRRRVFHRRLMQSHELLREVFEKKSAKEVSADLALSTSMIYKWAQPSSNDGGVENPLDRMESLFRSTGDHRLIQWLCQRAGGFFIHNPKTQPHPHFLIPATNQIVQEFADLLQVIAAAAADNQITTAESQQIRARWEELKSVTESFVVCCENGNFRPIQNSSTENAAAKLAGQK
jgi:hypothetical protein